MTNLIQSLATALERLATLEAIVARIDKLEDRVQRLGVEAHEQITINHLGEIRAESHGARIDKLETLQYELGSSLGITDRSLNRIEDRVRILEENGDGGEDLEDRIGEILDRKLDHVLEDAVTEALSGREITICL